MAQEFRKDEHHREFDQRGEEPDSQSKEVAGWSDYEAVGGKLTAEVSALEDCL